MSHQFLRRALVVCILIPLFAFSFLLFQFNRLPFARAKLEKLSTGMTKGEIRKILGGPATVYGENNNVWVYGRFFAWLMVTLEFDADGQLKRFEYDY